MTGKPSQMTSDEIRDAFLSACHAELQALKPGNVHVFAPGHDMTLSDFEISAKISAPIIADQSLKVGARINDAVAATIKATNCNTNLGILLLCGPLAAAACAHNTDQTLQHALQHTLSALDQSDADNVFAAIRLANPGGLGEAARGDVTKGETHDLGLVEAMSLSAHFDRIAESYSNGFEDIFAHHLPSLRRAKASKAGLTITDPCVVTMLHMQILQDFPDSHIQRKFGADAARAVRQQARELRPFWHPDHQAMTTPAAHQKLLEFDQDLKAEGLNPGTTADFVVATVFAEHISRRFDAR